ncbi:MAG: transposase [Cyanobacteria bacterium P01_G01_bin.54]
MPTIAERTDEIQRIQRKTFQQSLNETLAAELRSNVVKTVKTVLESALVEELKLQLEDFGEARPRRSGYYPRVVDTQYGRINQLRVPKLRERNRERDWQILERYQRGIQGFLDWVCYLYVLGLSIRDLQVLLYWQLGEVLSCNAINQVTLRVQERIESERQSRIEQTPSVLIVDGVWVEIQYTTGEVKLDRSGHQRQVRHAQDRVILAVMAVWPDGTHEMLHYEIAQQEETTAWQSLFEHLIARGLDPHSVEVVVSDGARGLLAAMAQTLPQTKQQRCITHKVRGMDPYLKYKQLPTTDEQGQPLDPKTAKQQRKSALFNEAYDIYDAATYEEAQQRKQTFVDKWKDLEPDAIHAFEWGLKRTFTFYQLDESWHRFIRTTNPLERFFREFRAKADEVGAFPNEQSCLALFFLVKQLEHAKHDRPALANKSGH